MKRFVIALALGLGVAAAPASAVTITKGAINDPTPAGGYAPGSTFESFDSYSVGSVAPGFTGGAVQVGTTTDQYAAPFGDTTNYYSAGPSTSSPATLAVSGGLNRFSLYWGSIDSYNTITFLGLGTSFTGSAFLDGNANATISRVVSFDFTPAEAALITGIQFSSTQNAFEFDNLQMGSAVPEPSVWAMMMIGFGLIGAALRRRAPNLGGAVSAA